MLFLVYKIKATRSHQLAFECFPPLIVYGPGSGHQNDGVMKKKYRKTLSRSVCPDPWKQTRKGLDFCSRVYKIHTQAKYYLYAKFLKVFQDWGDGLEGTELMRTRVQVPSTYTKAGL